MAQRPQRRLRRRGQTLRPRRARREPQHPRRAGRHGRVPGVHPLRRRARPPGQHGLVGLLRRRRVPRPRGPVCDMRVGSVLRAGRDGVCGGYGGEGVMGVSTDGHDHLWIISDSGD